MSGIIFGLSLFLIYVNEYSCSCLLFMVFPGGSPPTGGRRRPSEKGLPYSFYNFQFDRISPELKPKLIFGHLCVSICCWMVKSVSVSFLGISVPFHCEVRSGISWICPVSIIFLTSLNKAWIVGHGIHYIFLILGEPQIYAMTAGPWQRTVS